MTWGNEKEQETRRRIKLSLWAYAYDFESDSMVSDGEFDDECKKVRLEVDTNRPDLDKWWRDNFSPSTGQWIRKHPELDGIKKLYKRLKELKEEFG